MKRTKEEIILSTIAGFLKYTVQDNVIVECNKKGKEEFYDLIKNNFKDIEKYGGKVIFGNFKSWREYDPLLKNEKKSIILVSDSIYFPKKNKNICNLFYYLSRLPVEIKLTNFILVRDNREFINKLDSATMSSLMPRTMELKEISPKSSNMKREVKQDGKR